MLAERIREHIGSLWRSPSRPPLDPAQEGTPTPAVDAGVRSRAEEVEVSARLLEISRAAVALADLGPKLVSLSGELETLAGGQAQQTESISGTTARLAQHLRSAVDNLRSSSAQVESSLSTVGRIAASTKIISINASIEAARAGQHGKAFGVVVGEIQRLSEESGGVTKDIESRVSEMHSSIVRVEGVAGQTVPAETGEEPEVSVETVNEGVKSLANAATRQLAEARLLNEIGTQMNQLADRLLKSVGGFRFELHSQAEAALTQLAEAMAGTDSRETREAMMTHWLVSNPAFELVYATDPQGQQDVDNLLREDGGVRRDPAGYGKDWSKRPWFVEALAAEKIACSDLYVSAATGDFCFTVSARVLDLKGSVRGVVAGDVNFRRLLEG